jgi:hypothetical protein
MHVATSDGDTMRRERMKAVIAGGGGDEASPEPEILKPKIQNLEP